MKFWSRKYEIVFSCKTYRNKLCFIYNLWKKFFYIVENHLKGIVHFEIKIWYLSAYPKGIQDVGVFFSSVDPILMF